MVVSVVLASSLRQPWPIDVPASLLAVELLSTLVDFALVFSLLIIGLVMWSRKLTPQQFFWLVTVLVSISFVVTMLLAQRHM